MYAREVGELRTTFGSINYILTTHKSKFSRFTDTRLKPTAPTLRPPANKTRLAVGGHVISSMMTAFLTTRHQYHSHYASLGPLHLAVVSYSDFR